MSVDGTWELTIRTPIGKQQATLEITEHDGRLRGVARGDAETVELIDLQLNEGHLTWRQSITKPLRLNLRFDMAVDGDEMAGASKAGRLPSSKATARRVPPQQAA